MATLSASARARLPDSAFAYIDAAGMRRLPIHDASHVRNALARFDQVEFEDEAARARARAKLLRAASRYGIAPLGFFHGQLRKERRRPSAGGQRGWPRGNVAFLLTDIEGSTRLLQELGDGYTSVLRAVRSLIRGAVRRGGGHEVDARADEFFAAFHDAGDAVHCAVAIQRALAAHEWPRGARVRVRIGVHAGRSTLSDAGYVGIAVHTAARICGAGHGGQILVSATAHDALVAPLDGLRLRRLGEYALPSLAEPLTLYQVAGAGLRPRFRRLRS